MVDITGRAHYDKVADYYDSNYAYSPEFIGWMSRCIIDRLAPVDGERVADVGCGTGLYSVALAEAAGAVLCVDPSAEMLRQLPGSDAYTPVVGSAEDVAAGRVEQVNAALDAVLIKEAIHHVADIDSTVRGLSERLSPGGRLLIVMLPVTIEYPLFTAALERYTQAQPDPEAVARSMRDAGLTAQLSYEEYMLNFPREKYIEMVRSRYMSLLSTFDDEELEQGIAEIRRSHPEERLRFPDRFAFILGVSPSVAA